METSLQNEMLVTKRNGDLETIEFDKILKRLKSAGQEVGIQINYTALVMKVIDQLYDKIPTTKIDDLTAEQCASMSSIHTDYNILAGRIVVSNHHKNTSNSFSEVMSKLYNYLDKQEKSSPLISEELYEISQKYSLDLDKLCNYNQDYLIDYFGFKTLEKSYLMRINGKIMERPQHMWLRVAIGIHGENMEKVYETYNYMSKKYFTHATPTLFNAGTPRPQNSSCFLQCMESDSIEGIYNTLKDCALISKWAGGIGLHIHNVRASGSHIRGTNGSSNGIVPMLRVFNHTAKYVDQCLDPDTIVYTKRGILPIKNIVVGDEVITDDGNFYEIGKVLDNDYFGDMYEIDIKHTLTPLKLTDMHPLWTIKNDMNIQRDFISIKNMLDRNLITAEFIEVKNINKNDFIGFPIPRYEKDNIHFTEEDCRFYGILLSIGDINNTNNTYYLVLNEEKQANTILFIKEYLSKLNIDISYSKKNEKYLTISWNRTSIFKFTYEMCYDNNKKKNVMPSILHLPKSKILQFIKGILETDGIITDNQITLVMTSKNIIESVRYMLLRLSILTSGAVGDIISGQINYILYIPTEPIICNLISKNQVKPSTNITFFEHDKYLFSIVNKNTLISNYSGRVIDIEVDNENHHNFLTHNGLVKNGGGRRHGSFAIYLEPWHADIELFLQMRKNHGDEELKARDLFYALWIPDLFMERIKNNGKWTLMCPDECPGLSDVYGEEFDKLYIKYETEGKGRNTMNARDLWFQVLDAQMETGTPYLLFKDAVNRKSNQKNVGTIKSSNLCTEITEYSDDTETAVCNLASIALPSYLDHSREPPTFDYEKLHEVTKVVTENLNRIIDVNYYPTEKTRKSNMRHRPIGIGIQGLADVFIMMDMAFTSEEAKEVNRKIFETMYHAALERSCELAQKEGSYETFVGSPTSQGILQFDMWDFDPTNIRYDWTKMREQIKEYGLRNSLLLAPMPTASTSQILGFNECFEPITSNIYSRRTIAGEFIMTNKYLMSDLIKINLWNEKIKNNIIANNGSIQHIEIIPENIREKYRTVWEIPMKTVIDMAADRGVYICQSQSMNTWIEEPNYNALTSMHFYSWKKGLKTGMYYLRRRAAHQAQQFTIEPERKNMDDDDDDNDVCEMCSG